jgi:hypothetical protein
MGRSIGRSIVEFDLNTPTGLDKHRHHRAAQVACSNGGTMSLRQIAGAREGIANLPTAPNPVCTNLSSDAGAANVPVHQRAQPDFRHHWD